MIQNVKKVLAPIDFSDFSMDAMRSAWELAKDLGAEMHIVHIVAPHHSFLEQQSTEITRATAIAEQSEEELTRIKKTDFGNSPKIVTAVITGSPVVKLCEYAQQNQIDLIMLSTHGHTGPEFLRIGSVAEKIARNAPCSVLVYRKPKR
ncbi:MAG TPA: universal stress protein [Candidatus Binataceae bacterium]|nr:universal stress protein [Candidatus Binataceae bacterium]